MCHFNRLTNLRCWKEVLHYGVSVISTHTWLDFLQHFQSSTSNQEKSTVYDILDYSVLPILWQQFGEDPLTWQCSHAQSQVLKEMVVPVWYWRTWLARTELWPRPHVTPLGWTGRSTVNSYTMSGWNKWINAGKMSGSYISAALTKTFLPKTWNSNGIRTDIWVNFFLKLHSASITLTRTFRLILSHFYILMHNEI